jgi:hypothetical protein
LAYAYEEGEMSELIMLGKLVSAIGTLMPRLLSAQERKKTKVAEYFQALGDTLARIAAALRAAKSKDDIPRVDGNTFEALLGDFDAVVRPLFRLPTRKDREALDKTYETLEQAAEWARRIDGSLIVYSPSIDADKEPWIADLERIAGELRAHALRLRVT